MSLQSNNTLTSLNLESNQLSGESILAVAESLKFNSTLKELTIGKQEQDCDPQIEEKIAQAILENKSLVKFQFQFKDPVIQKKVEKHIAKI